MKMKSSRQLHTLTSKLWKLLLPSWTTVRIDESISPSSRCNRKAGLSHRRQKLDFTSFLEICMDNQNDREISWHTLFKILVCDKQQDLCSASRLGLMRKRWKSKEQSLKSPPHWGFWLKARWRIFFLPVFVFLSATHTGTIEFNTSPQEDTTGCFSLSCSSNYLTEKGFLATRIQTWVLKTHAHNILGKNKGVGKNPT